MNPQQEALAVRRGAGLFRLSGRGLVEVTGADRVRWLNGMVSNDVAALAERGPGAGCYALLLSAQGRIVADLHVLLREDAIWLETGHAAVATVIERLERFVIADDVTLLDRSDGIARLAVEGPAAPRVLEAALGRPLELGSDAYEEAVVAEVPLLIAAFGFTGGPAFQLLIPGGSEASVYRALLREGEPRGLVPAGPEALEILRIEAGTPWLGSELDESVLPDEARLDRAVSTTKGCYTGQEVVARLRSRGGVKHRLVGLVSERETPPPAGASVAAGEQRIGEVTSATISPANGPIALAYVRRPHDAPGTRVEADGAPARVVDLPFVVPGG